MDLSQLNPASYDFGARIPMGTLGACRVDRAGLFQVPIGIQPIPQYPVGLPSVGRYISAILAVIGRSCTRSGSPFPTQSSLLALEDRFRPGTLVAPRPALRTTHEGKRPTVIVVVAPDGVSGGRMSLPHSKNGPQKERTPYAQGHDLPTR